MVSEVAASVGTGHEIEAADFGIVQAQQQLRGGQDTRRQCLGPGLCESDLANRGGGLLLLQLQPPLRQAKKSTGGPMRWRLQETTMTSVPQGPHRRDILGEGRAGAAFFALRAMGRSAMFLAQAAVRNGAGIIPGAPTSEGFIGAAKSICHGLRLISVKDFELYQSQQPDAKIPDWVGEVRVAKFAPTEDFNRDLMSAKCALIFKQKTAPQAAQSSPAPG